jgi:hypothetical protein
MMNFSCAEPHEAGGAEGDTRDNPEVRRVPVPVDPSARRVFRYQHFRELDSLDASARCSPLPDVEEYRQPNWATRRSVATPCMRTSPNEIDWMNSVSADSSAGARKSGIKRKPSGSANGIQAYSWTISRGPLFSRSPGNVERLRGGSAIRSRVELLRILPGPAYQRLNS